MCLLFKSSKRDTAWLMLFCLILLPACTPGTRMLNQLPIHSVDVKVVDQNDRPIQGAQVEASNGRRTATDADGMAKVRFGSVGIHSISIVADNHMPANMVVTLPADRGKTLTTRLTDQISFTGITFHSPHLYPLLFNYLFASYGYSLQLSDYREGDWTRWSIHTEGEEETYTMHKAFLKELDNGQQWWQVQIHTDDKDGDPSTYVAEILFSRDRTSIRRLRERIGDGEVQDKPVAEDWYTKPTELTEESIRGAVNKRDVPVTVPGGTFTADVLTYGIASGTSLNLWRTDQVPGGVVKYENRTQQGTIYISELADYGNDAQTLLGSY